MTKRGTSKATRRPAAKRPAAKRPPVKRAAVKHAASQPVAGKRASRDIEGALNARRRALADLMHSQALGQGDIRAAVRQITETAAQVLDVERASVWQLVDGGCAIECIDLYERSQARHSAGTRIRAADVPRYFAALQTERAIRAHDARSDPRTSEFRKGYLEPLGIRAMLDAPVFLRGKMVGVVCHEHTKTARRWQQSEELLAGTFADFVALVLETSAWHRPRRRCASSATRSPARSSTARASWRRARRTCARWSISRPSRWC